MSAGWRALRIGYVMQADAAEMSEVSGPKLHVEATVRGLEQRGHRVRMVAIQNGKTLWTDDLVNWQSGEYRLSTARWFRAIESVLRGIQSRLHLPFLRLFDSYRFSDACAQALNGCDIVYERFGLISYGGLFAAKRLRIPIIYEVNGDLVEEFAQQGIHLSKMQWTIINGITRWMFTEAAHVVAVGETIKRRIAQRWKLRPESISIVRNGANVDLFLTAPLPEPAAVKQTGDANVIFVGSFQPWHGVDLLVKAFSRVAAARPDARLLLVGDGPRRSEVEQEVQRRCLSTHVQFLGRVAHENVVGLLAKAEVAVLCHPAASAEIVETPLKLFEYMAAGKAIAAPRVPNMQRVLVEGVNGILFTPDDAEQLADVILKLLSDSRLRSVLGEAARRDAIEKYSWQRAVKEVETIMLNCEETWSK